MEPGTHLELPRSSAANIEDMPSKLSRTRVTNGSRILEITSLKQHTDTIWTLQLIVVKNNYLLVL